MMMFMISLRWARWREILKKEKKLPFCRVWKQPRRGHEEMPLMGRVGGRKPAVSGLLALALLSAALPVAENFVIQMVGLSRLRSRVRAVQHPRRSVSTDSAWARCMRWCPPTQALFVHAYVYICIFPICASVYMCMWLCVWGWVLPVFTQACA